ARQHAGGEERREDEDDLALHEPPEEERRRGVAGLETGLCPREVHGSEQQRGREQADLPEQRLAVGRLPERREGRQLLESLADPRADQQQHGTEGDGREAWDDGRKGW